jgi:membrane-associated phospholipid phosphatase
VRRLLICASVLALTASSAAAEPWYRGPHGNNRVFHLTLSASLGVGFFVTEGIFKSGLAAEDCRWCEPNSLDVRVRDALVWDDYDAARMYSNLTGYVAMPVFAVGITALSSLDSSDKSWARVLDDTLPVLESVAISQALTQVVKFSVARQRPFVHFRDTPQDSDDNMSFWSGHSALAFGLTTSAGLIAHWRHNKLEPVIWGVGGALSISTAYFRIAADRHYFTDVLTGSAVGVLAGLTIPRLMRREDMAVIPMRDGVALAGSF